MTKGASKAHYAEISASPIELLVEDTTSPYCGESVVLMGRYSPPGGAEVLLVRRTQRPFLTEIPAGHTNIHSVEIPPYEEPQKLDAAKLLEAHQIMTAALQVPERQPEEA